MKYLYEQDFGKIESIEVAKRLLKDKSEITYGMIKCRNGGYFVEDHHKKIEAKINDASDREIEKQIFRQAIIDNYINYGIDYEINIEPGIKRNIDVLFTHEGELYIGEAKGPKASGDKTLLKAVLEIYTYSQLINKEQLFNDYLNNLAWVNGVLNNKKDIKLAIILFEKKDGKPSPMYRQLITEDRYAPVRELMKQLKIYAIKAEGFCNGKIEFFDGYSPKNY